MPASRCLIAPMCMSTRSIRHRCGHHDGRRGQNEPSLFPATSHRDRWWRSGRPGAATKLGDRLGRREKAEITLIERARTHIWKPHLHEVAAGTMDVGREAVDYLAQAADHCFRYRIGEMIGLNRAHREVHVSASTDAEGNEITPPRSIPYDTLVIAVGSTSNDFGTPGAKEHAISLDTPEQAVRFHQRLVNRFIRAHAQPDPVRPGQLHVAIIGAGATGTELAAELHRTTRQVVAYGLDRIDVEKDLKITLVEA